MYVGLAGVFQGVNSQLPYIFQVSNKEFNAVESGADSDTLTSGFFINFISPSPVNFEIRWPIRMGTQFNFEMGFECEKIEIDDAQQ